MLSDVVPRAWRVWSISILAPSSLRSAFIRLAEPSSRVFTIFVVKSCLAVTIPRLVASSLDFALSVSLAVSRVVMAAFIAVAQFSVVVDH